MIGGKQHHEKIRRTPSPVAQRNISRLERTPVNHIARNKSWQQAQNDDETEQQMIHEQLCHTAERCGFAASRGCANSDIRTRRIDERFIRVRKFTTRCIGTNTLRYGWRRIAECGEILPDCFDEDY